MHIFQTCRTVCLIVPTVVGTEDNPLSATIPACSIASQKILRAAGAQIAVSKPPFCEFDGLLERLFAFNVVDYAKPHGERKTLGPYLPHCGECLKEKPRTVFKTPTVLVCSLVCERRKVTLPEKAVREVKLKPLKACFQSSLRCIDESRLSVGNVLLRHFMGNPPGVAS